MAVGKALGGGTCLLGREVGGVVLHVVRELSQLWEAQRRGGFSQLTRGRISTRNFEERGRGGHLR